MLRLVVNPGSPAAWEIPLKSGSNLVGRSSANDITITDPSVSGSHCRLDVSGESVHLTDLGSTNGTFVDERQVTESVLRPGQLIRLGGVKVAVVGAEETRAAAPSLPVPPPPVPAARPVPAAAASTQAIDAAPHTCKHHPKTPGRFFCRQCGQFFCELCVSTRQAGGAQHKFCRHCGAECAPVHIRTQPVEQKGFFSRFPGAFLYPFRGAGVLMVVAGMVILAMLKFGAMMMQMGSLRFLVFGLILQIFAGGYLFSFLQNIIHSTAAEDPELPDLPGLGNFMDDILLPFLRLLGLVTFCFGPAIVLAVWLAISGNSALGIAVLAAMLFGLAYFPMAFLAVAILDTFTAANPLVVVPSILKVPAEYLVTLLVLGAVFGFRALGEFLVSILFPEGFSTHSMGALFGMLGAQVFWAFISLYLLIVATHLLGLLYVTRKHKLGWLEH
jgi:hypothetical protein